MGYIPAVVLCCLGAGCSPKEQDQDRKKTGSNDKIDQSKAMKHSPESSPQSVGKGVVVGSSALETLPRIASSGGKAEESVLKQIGVPYAAVPAIAERLQTAFGRANTLRGQSASSLVFPIGKTVTIEALPDEELSGIVRDFIAGLRKETKDLPLESLEILLREQLHDQFGLRMRVTLEQTGIQGLSDLAHSTPETRGLTFQVEREKGDGRIEKFSLNPIQGERSEFFYLKASP
ncbi:hypothetical protein [Haloferula sp. BvORR071]|uniref:hypothetical protein n=1 Tax=Haloferula sp. BvORR071 TaxID=1396141 RepID=UPI002240FD80|nr:hypothetical protein [Haloferula sp. BvORR071]